MARIRILDDGTINRIAAGEVVERPRSVVKELVENALDAGARRIEVEIEQGGRSLVRVIDDGEGMDEDDMLLALERHATSKIRDAAELAALDSLGFRGEALPSIASVSHLEILTRPADRDAAMVVRSRGGTIQDLTAAAGRPGTTVTVRRLFFNTPARQKHLRSEAIEAGHVRDFMVACSLARPEVAFRLSSANKTLLEAPGTGRLLDALSAVFGARAARDFLPIARVEHAELPYAISGYVGGPQLSRASSKHLFWCVNGRTFQSPYLTRAVVDAYMGRLAERRWPVGAIVVDADPRVVDVNVHPAKTEVRFSFHQRLRPFVVQTVRDAVARAAAPFRYGGGRTAIDGTPTLEKKGAAAVGEGRERPAMALRSQGAQAAGGQPMGTQPRDRIRRPKSEEIQLTLEHLYRPVDILPREGAGPSKPSHDGEGVRPFGEGSDVTPTRESTGGAPADGCDVPTATGANAIVASAGFDTAFRRGDEGPFEVLGQIFGTYLLVRSRKRFMLVDQHAAHERIRYERIGRSLREGGGPVQGLLLPIVIELEAADLDRLRHRANLLEGHGFRFDWAEEGQVRVLAFPSILEAAQIEGILRDVTDGLAEGREGDAVEDEVERLARLMACHGAIRAGDAMTPPEICRLFEDLSRCEYPMTCPHGRPTLIEFSEHEIRKLFARE